MREMTPQQIQEIFDTVHKMMMEAGAATAKAGVVISIAFPQDPANPQFQNVSTGITILNGMQGSHILMHIINRLAAVAEANGDGGTQEAMEQLEEIVKRVFGFLPPADSGSEPNGNDDGGPVGSSSVH